MVQSDGIEKTTTELCPDPLLRLYRNATIQKDLSLEQTDRFQEGNVRGTRYEFTSRCERSVRSVLQDIEAAGTDSAGGEGCRR